MPETLKDCRCLDKEDKEWLIKAMDDAIGYNAYRTNVAKEKGLSGEVKRLSERKWAFQNLRDDVKNTPVCK